MHHCLLGISHILLGCRQVDLDEVLGWPSPVVWSRLRQLAAPRGHIESHGVALFEGNLPPLPLAVGAIAIAVGRYDPPETGQKHEQNYDDCGRAHGDVQLTLFAPRLGRFIDQFSFNHLAHA